MAWRILDYPTRLLNTVVMTVLCTVGHIFSCSLAGYAFARYRYRHTKIMFALTILALVLPVQTTVVANYILFTKIGIVNSVWPIILPTFFAFGLKGPLFVFVYRQFFLSLPVSLEEAARIDGCGPVRIFTRIAFPTASASTLICVVLSIVWHWNDYFEPSMYITDPKAYILPQRLPDVYSMLEEMQSNPAVFGGFGGVDLSTYYNAALIMAAMVLVILPVLVIYFILQHWFIQSIELTGITGE